MPIFPDLITGADLTTYGYDQVAAGKITAASARIRRYTRQQITAGTSSVELTGVGPWLLPQRPVIDVTSVLDSKDEEVTYDLIGQRVYSQACAPLIVEYSHGFDPLPDDLVELVCQIATRLVNTPAAMAAGARTEQAGGESVTWGADAYVGTSGLTKAEELALDKIYPKRPRTAILL